MRPITFRIEVVKYACTRLADTACRVFLCAPGEDMARTKTQPAPTAEPITNLNDIDEALHHTSRALERNKNRTTLLPMLQEIFLTKPYEEWEPLLLANDIPVGAINNLAQVVEHPQVKARNTLIEVEHPRAGKVRVIRSPVRLSKAPFAVRSPAPMLGQHTQEVLRDVLGMKPAEIAALEAAGALGAKPSK